MKGPGFLTRTLSLRGSVDDGSIAETTDTTSLLDSKQIPGALSAKGTERSASPSGESKVGGGASYSRVGDSSLQMPLLLGAKSDKVESVRLGMKNLILFPRFFM